MTFRLFGTRAMLKLFSWQFFPFYLQTIYSWFYLKVNADEIIFYYTIPKQTLKNIKCNRIKMNGCPAKALGVFDLQVLSHPL